MSVSQNQLQDILGRPPTAQEFGDLSNASIDNILNYKKTSMGVVNIGNNPTTIPTTIVPNQPDNNPAGVAGKNTSGNNETQGEQDAFTEANKTSDQQTADKLEQNQANGQIDSPALAAYKKSQQDVADIDNELDTAYESRRQAVIASGGIVDEAQLKSEVAYEKAPLLIQRKEAAARQAQLGKDYQAEANRQQQLAIANAKITQTGNQNAVKNDQFNAKLNLTQQQDQQKNAQANAKTIISAIQKGSIDLTSLSSDQLSNIESSAGLPAGALTNLKNGAMLDPATVDMLSQQVVDTGTIPTGLSRLGGSGVGLAQILNAAADKYKANGGSIPLALQKEQYQANSKSLSSLQQYADKVGSSENKVQLQIPILQNLSDQIPRTDSPEFNAWQQAITTRITGNSPLARFSAAVDTFTSEYGKIMSGATGAAGSSDAATAKAQGLLQTAMNNGTFTDEINNLKYEMDTTTQGNQQQIDDIRGRTGNAAPTGSTDKVLSGVNWDGYASSSDDFKGLSNNYSKINAIANGVITDADGAQAVISKLSPNSPITGDMIMLSAQKYGVEPNLLMARLAQESNFGMTGKGQYTKNAGNIGNDDTGKLNYQDSWQDGIDLVANWMAMHETGATNGTNGTNKPNINNGTQNNTDPLGLGF